MRCARCGNENSDANRFCGMCGAKLLTEGVPVASATAENTASRSTAVHTPVTVPSAALSNPTAPQGSTPQVVAAQTAAPTTSAPRTESAPIISGPSFLGLDKPEPAPVRNSTRRRGSLSIDPNSAPGSNNLDYLLQDDEEEERRGGGGKFVLILLALALAVGLGYLRWRNQGFGWLGSGTGKPSAAAQTSDGTQPNSTTTPSSTTSTPAASTADAPAALPAASAPAATPAPSQPASIAPPAVASTATSPTPNLVPDTVPANAAPAAVAAPSSGTATPSPPAAKAPPPATADTPRATSAKPSKSADPPPAKPTAAIKPAPKVDPVSEAQKYLYGRGVPQNCDRGLRLLKPAADQSDPKAMIEMGALYSAGLCTPHDLPTAYRWFALALRKDPDNQAVASDLQKLWGEMTQAERQLAIKLSQ